MRYSRDFRFLAGSGLVTMLGGYLTLVAVPYQMKLLTGSYVAVGLVSLAEFVPMVVCGLWGGAIADALDRRRVIVLTELGMGLTSVSLLVNALMPHPQVWVLYTAGALSAGFSALQRPSLTAMLPRVVSHEHMSAAIAIDGARWNLGAIVGPALAGFAVTGLGLAPSYAVVPAFYAISLLLLWRIGASPPRENGSTVSVRAMIEGVRYAVSRPDLIGTYVVDIAANLFAYVTALYPFLADELHQPNELGLLYSAWGFGALAASVTSGWTRHVHRHGLAVILAASSWGVAIALAAVMPNLWLVLVFLCLGGVADMISGLFRMTLWNQTIPDELRGRLAGIEMLSYLTGPMMGNARAGFMAQLGGVRFSLGAGGLLCVGAVAAMAGALPKFRRYDQRTDEHATAERARRVAAASAATAAATGGSTSA